VSRVGPELRRALAGAAAPAREDLELAQRPVDRPRDRGGVGHVEGAGEVEGLEGVAALLGDWVVGSLGPGLGAELGHHQRQLGIQVAHLLQVQRQVVEVLNPAVPAEVLVDSEHVELVVGELLRMVGAAVDVDGDRQRRVLFARDLLRPFQVETGHVRPFVRARPQLVGHRVGDHRRVAARRDHGAADGSPGALALHALAQHVGLAVALPDRRLVPDHDPGSVEPLQQPLVEEVMGARHVGAQLLQVGHDPVHVRRRERGAAAGHVLVDRGAGQLDAAVVEVEQPALHRHRAQADAAPVDVLHRAAVAQHDSRRVELRVLGLPQLGGGDRHLDAHTAPLAPLVRQPERAPGDPARGRAQLHLERRRQRLHSGALQHPVHEQLRAAAGGRPAAGHLGHRPEVAEVGTPGGDQVDGAHDPAPVPPALGQARILAAVDHHDQEVLATGPQAACFDRERGVRVHVLAEPVAVEEHDGRPPYALELDQPAKAARRGGTLEVQPVAAHLPAVLGRHRLGVEDARDRHRAPAAGLLGCRAAGSPLAARGHVLGLALERRGRLVGRGSGRLVADLPAR
jgi:hypothetical protein